MSETLITNNGILLLEKPLGWSSHGVVNAVRRATGIKRVGHTGTLDPFATGLLIILVGRDNTKLQDLFLKQDKCYRCQFILGHETTTLDCSGEITLHADAAKLAAVTKPEVLAALATFTGQQTQQAPAFAAIKVSGEKLYTHALKLLHDPDKSRFNSWQDQLPSRQVTIQEIRLLQFQHATTDQPITCDIEVKCSSGTYIRSLIKDVGRLLGVYATATKLQRTHIGKLNLTAAQTVNKPETWRWYQAKELLEKI